MFFPGTRLIGASSFFALALFMIKPFPFHALVRVRTYELDSFGHVNKAVYLHYLEEARSEFLKQMGLSFDDFGFLNVQLVIVEAHVHYLSAAKYGDGVKIVGQFRDVRPASLTLDYVLTEQESGRLLARAWTRGAFVSTQTGKPCRTPDRFRDAFTNAAASSASRAETEPPEVSNPQNESPPPD